MLSLFVWWQRAPAPAAPHASAISQRVVAPAPHAAQLPPVTHLRPAPPLPRTKPSPPPAVVEPTQGRRPIPPSATQGPVRLSALPATQRKALPPLQLSMHLWNQDPALRFAIIDGQRVVEGDRVGDAVVAAIRRDGVVLDWNGEQILVGLP